MKVKLAQVVGSVEPLGKLMSNPMPAATAFRCAKVLKAVQSELETYDEARKTLIEKYGEDGEMKPESKDWDKFIKEMNTLLDEEINVNGKKIKADSLSKIEVAPTDLLSLDWLIKE